MGFCVAALPDVRSLCLDDCEGLLPSGPKDMAFLGKLTRLESLTWTNRTGAPTWIASDAELHDDCSRAASVLTHIPNMPRLRMYATFTPLSPFYAVQHWAAAVQ